MGSSSGFYCFKSNLERGENVFRLDINALRALSVVAVVGFHLKMPGFAGGFVGVDIFLVITGYLMTMKVLRDLAQGRFSFWRFWIMRMRRIYPALAAVIVVTVIAGWFLTMPDQYLKHMLQALSALAFLSNFAFSDANGYFAMAAQTKPLLHTWSLSVEWQFYFWLPIAVWLLWRSSSDPAVKIKAIRSAFVIAIAASLAWCVWKSYADATATSFFSLQARAWEPLAGGLIAVAEVRHPLDDSSRSFWSKITAILGWLLLIACIAYPLPENHWPSLITSLPIVGSVLVIAARRGTDGNRVLEAYPLQRLGDWSYSIYLWHWPLWVFALGWLSLRGYTVGIGQKAAIAIASVALGCASYHWIEQPIRLNREFWTPRRLIRSASVSFAGGAVFVGVAFLNDGFPSRLPDYLRPAELARRMNTPRDECFRNSNAVKKTPGDYCDFGKTSNATSSLILWGDSFANQYLEPVSSVANELRIHGLIATQSGCRAFVDDTQLHAGDSRACREFNRKTLDFVLGPNGPNIVVLASNWSNAEEIANLVDRLLSSGKTVVLVMPLLAIGFDVPQRWIGNQIRAGHAIPEWKVEANPALTMQKLRGEMYLTILQKHKNNPHFVVADPQPVVCEHNSCYLVRDGQANFRDTAHISNVNSMQYRGMFEAALK
jgi:peptidoglycan/LPS O-acetylase OafA/YrhL